MIDQSKFLQKLTPEERLQQAFLLSDFSRELALNRITRENPEDSQYQLQKKLIHSIHGNIRTKRSSSLYR